VDISHAFLNGDLEEMVYMKQPEGFHQGPPNHVCHLKKSIYGLKQAARQWNKKMHSAFLSMGFKRLESDHSIYLYTTAEVKIIVPIHVDDITLASSSKTALDKAINDLSQHFRLKNLGPTSFLLGVEIIRDRPNRTIRLSQRQYIIDMLDNFGFADCNPISTPMNPGSALTWDMSPQSAEDIASMASVPYINAVGALMYLATTTRPDISYTVGVLGRFASKPGMSHWKAVKHLFRYLKGTLDLGIVYGPHSSGDLMHSFSDSDHGGDKVKGRSTGGYAICIGSGAVSWSSKLQSLVALSTTEAEYIAAVEAGKEIIWMRYFLTELGYPIGKTPSKLHMDNQSAISVAKNPEHHGRMKHLDLRFHWLRDTVESGAITPSFIPTNEMAADILTKALCKQRVEECRRLLGIS
jgi:hypothetical protein